MTVFRTLRSRGSASLAVYVAVVTCLAIAAFVVSSVQFGVEPAGDRWLAGFVLVAVLLWAEIRPITVLRAGVVEHVVASTTFAFAIFLMFGVVPAMVALALASALADWLDRKPLIKVVFNIAQYWVAWGVAAFVYAGVMSGADGWRDQLFGTRWYLAVLVAGLTYFLVNNLLVGIVIGISGGGPIVRATRASITSEWSTDAVLLGLTPVVVIVAEQSAVALPLLLLPIVAVYRSVTISAEKQRLALHDPLTDLPNRINFTAAVSTCADRLVRGRSAAVMLLDLDHFKDINDTLGHQAGDELLKRIGPRLSEVAPPGSVVARFGGDEFALLIPDVTDEREALGMAHAVVDALSEPFSLAGINFEVSASIGVALCPEDGADADSLLKNADVAMYVAKQQRTVVERYASQLDHNSTRRLEMVAELRAAIAQGDIAVLYQPKLSLERNEVHEVEVLVRWRHPTLGMVPPSEFVPLAEHTGLIGPLTTHVLDHSLRQVTAWRNVGIDLVVAVNLSTRSLYDHHIVDEVASALGESRNSSRSLRLEITEGSIMVDPERAFAVLDRLAGMGVRLSVDDFGTGYSSLAYLKQLPIDEIKIDRSFVSEVHESAGDQAIVRAIIELAQSLGLTSVAEGVEGAGQLEWLIGSGCAQAQGHHIARPLSADALTEWLTDFRATSASGGSPDDVSVSERLRASGRP